MEGSACAQADMVIMTNDSPWGEPPNEIIADMVRAPAACLAEQHKCNLRDDISRPLSRARLPLPQACSAQAQNLLGWQAPPPPPLEHQSEKNPGGCLGPQPAREPPATDAACAQVAGYPDGILRRNAAVPYQPGFLQDPGRADFNALEFLWQNCYECARAPAACMRPSHAPCPCGFPPVSHDMLLPGLCPSYNMPHGHVASLSM